MEITGGGGLAPGSGHLPGQQIADGALGAAFRLGFYYLQQAKIGVATITDGLVSKPGLA